MKYAAFGVALLIGVPVMTYAGIVSERLRGWLVTLLIFSVTVGDMVAINFISMETYRGPDRGFEVTLTDLIALALIGVAFACNRERIVWLPFNSLWLLALFVIACISAFGAMDPLVSAFSLWKWARAYVLYWCVVNLGRLEWPRVSVWRAMVWMGLYITFLALKQKYIHHIYRVSGPFDHSNTVPLYINQFLPILGIWGLSDRRLTHAMSGLSVIACLGLCVASQSTFSRLGLLLSLAGFVGALFVTNVRERNPRVRVATVVTIIGLVIGGILAAPSMIERIKSAPEESEEARHEFNIAAEQMAEDYPFGIGVNNFSRVLTRVGRYNQHISVMEDEEQAGVCHHIYFLTAAELGYPGLIVFAIILLRFLWHNLLGIFRSGKTWEGSLLWGFLFGACALHISGFMEWVVRITPVTYMFAICAGLMVGFAEQGREKAKRLAAKKRGAPCPT
ncbi:MAG: hypothetical protein OHK0029_12380 [Armatimonadaceae bacterium]